MRFTGHFRIVAPQCVTCFMSPVEVAYYDYYYYLLQLGFHLVAVVFTLAHNTNGHIIYIKVTILVDFWKICRLLLLALCCPTSMLWQLKLWQESNVNIVPAHSIKTYRRSWSISSLILNLGTTYRWVVNFSHNLRYSLGIEPQYLLNRSLDEFQIQSGCFWEEKTSSPARNQIPDFPACSLATTPRI
jgi:hypothetical protein